MTRATNRPKRTPIAQRNILTVANKRDGFKQRWVNDVDGRIQMFEEAGYTSVQRPTEVGDPQAGASTQVDRVVRKPVGGGITAVLMEIPEEYYAEDQQAKEAKIKHAEQSLLSEATDDEFYGDGIKVGKSLGKARQSSQRVQTDDND